MKYSLEERALGCLRGVAVGDALGRMTEGYWPGEIAMAYGGPITGFQEPIQPRSSHTWARAEVTDDTTFTLLLANSILAQGLVDRRDVARRILARPIKGWPGWAEFAAANDLEHVGHRTGTGAPSRIAPVGIICRPHDLSRLVDSVEQACIMTHHTASAISAAAAIAAAISAAVEGWPREQALALALEAASLGLERGQAGRAPGVAQVVEVGRQKLAGANGGLGWRLRGLNPGFEAWEGASFALCLVAGTESAREAILEAANQGGDADSIAAMSGGILGALNPDSLPAEWVAEVERANGLDLVPIARGLVALRRARK